MKQFCVERDLNKKLDGSKSNIGNDFASFLFPGRDQNISTISAAKKEKRGRNIRAMSAGKKGRDETLGRYQATALMSRKLGFAGGSC